MTEKRFTTVYDEQSKMIQYVDTQKEEPNKWAIWNHAETLQIMNELANENENNKKLIKLAYDDNNRLRNKNKRLHKDWDKLYELCREHLTDEEIIKELDR